MNTILPEDMLFFRVSISMSAEITGMAADSELINPLIYCIMSRMYSCVSNDYQNKEQLFPLQVYLYNGQVLCFFCRQEMNIKMFG